MLEDVERYRPATTRQLAALERALADGMPRRGWKIAINVPEILRSLGLRHSCVGWLDGHGSWRSGDVVEPGDDRRLHAEPELCLLLGRSVPPESSSDEALACVAAVAPAIELVDYARPAADLDAVVAGNAFHAGYVVGGWVSVDLVGRSGPQLPTLDVTGVSSPSPRDDLVPSHLGDLVRFAAAFLAAFGWRLEAGDHLLSGSFTARAVPLAPGASARADFGPLGAVEVRIAARDVVIEGSCLCGNIRYEARRTAGPMVNCHCGMCRKVHGTAFATILPVAKDGFRWTAGEAGLSHFESSPGKRRWFCARCGSHLVSTRDADERTLLLRAGSIDRGCEARPVAHGWVEFAAPWYEIGDDLPRFRRGFPGAPPGVE